MTRFGTALLAACCLAQTAMAGSYPVSGQWGENNDSKQGRIDCAGRRIVDFKGEERTDTGGGVPAYRNQSVSTEGATAYRVTDVFTNGQINNAQVNYTLRKVDDDRIELQMQSGSTLKLQRCK